MSYLSASGFEESRRAYALERAIESCRVHNDESVLSVAKEFENYLAGTGVGFIKRSVAEPQPLPDDASREQRIEHAQAALFGKD